MVEKSEVEVQETKKNDWDEGIIVHEDDMTSVEQFDNFFFWQVNVSS